MRAPSGDQCGSKSTPPWPCVICCRMPLRASISQRWPSWAPTTISPESADAGTAAGLDGRGELAAGRLAVSPDGVQAGTTSAMVNSRPALRRRVKRSSLPPRTPRPGLRFPEANGLGRGALRLHRRLRRARKSDADELSAPWRVGAGAGTSDGGDQAGELERGTEFVTVEMKVPVQPVVVGEPGEQGGTECVAGADGVDHIDGGSRGADLAAGADAKRAF